jgi:hypothetical protein
MIDSISATTLNISDKKCKVFIIVTVLYEGLKRAQRCRLEDQRGTEINFELPDFLKVSSYSSYILLV